MSRWVRPRCKECQSDDIVYDSAEGCEICRDCAVVQDGEGCFVDDFCAAPGPDAAGFGDAHMLRACEGTETTGRGGFDSHAGVSRKTLAIASRDEDAGKDAEVLRKFGAVVRERCNERTTGIKKNVQLAAVEILGEFRKRASSVVTMRNVEVYAAVCVFFATKVVEGCERTDVEIVNIFDVKHSRFRGIVATVLTALAGHPLHARISAINHPLALAPRLLDLVEDTRNDPALRMQVRKALTSDLYREAEAAMIDCGTDGNVISAALFHLASGRRVPTKMLACLVGYSNPTIVNACNMASPLVCRV